MTGNPELPPTHVHRFEHQAMATLFEVVIANEEQAYAQSAAAAAFQEIDRLELELSRYNPNSDISRLNNLPPHSTLRIGYDAFHCLLESLRYAEITAGAFDVTVGRLMDCWIGCNKSELILSEKEIEEALEGKKRALLELDRASMMVRTGPAAPTIDLGAIGKGYAVDRVVELLKEWNIASAMIHGGMSSVYAYGEYGNWIGWPVTISDPHQSGVTLQNILLNERSLGGSGVKKGHHIIDPRTGRPVRHHTAAWVAAHSATASDAVSTACMVMTNSEIQELIHCQPQLWAMTMEGPVNEQAGLVSRYGQISPD